MEWLGGTLVGAYREPPVDSLLLPHIPATPNL